MSSRLLTAGGGSTGCSTTAACDVGVDEVSGACGDSGDHGSGDDGVLFGELSDFLEAVSGGVDGDSGVLSYGFRDTGFAEQGSGGHTTCHHQ